MALIALNQLSLNQFLIFPAIFRHVFFNYFGGKHKARRQR